jgi:maltose O-acetyltransferase
MKVDVTCRIVSSAQIWGNFDIEIGKETFVGHEVFIVGGKSMISIGSHVDIAPRVMIVTGTHEIDMIGLRSAGTGYSKDVTIEDGVWIGANTTIIGGVTIGRKSIIGSGSVVTRSIPPYVIAVGNPCRPIKCWDADRGWQEVDK